MNANDMVNLMQVLGAHNEDETTCAPSEIQAGKYKSSAKPNMQVAVKKADDKKAAEKPIWDDTEFKAQSGVITKEEDDRAVPEYEILFQQNVGAEDVYLNLGQRDGSSDHCTHIIIKITLPNTKMKDISLDVLEDRLMLQGPKHRLNAALPYKVKKDSGDAKWDALKGILAVTLPINQKVKYYTKMEELMTSKDD